MFRCDSLRCAKVIVQVDAVIHLGTSYLINLKRTIMKKFLCRIIERVFPCETNRIKAGRLEKRTAMQQMLDADCSMRSLGYRTSYINEQLKTPLGLYNRGHYSQVGANIPWCV